MEKAGYGTLPFHLISWPELHVVQRAASPAREPGPVAVDVVARAIMPACVKQPAMMSAAAGFGAFGFSAFGFFVFYAGATFFARLLTYHFVSHNCGPFS